MNPIFFDGAMGTELHRRGITGDPAILNLTHPQDIIDIHREYLEAGADILTANTFGCYSHKHENAADMIKAAISHGRKALAGYPGRRLALDLGPTGLILEPYGDTTKEECRHIFEEAISHGDSCDLILIETMMDLTELKLAVITAKKTGLSVYATMSFEKNRRTMMGATIQDMIDLLEGLGVDALGLNCGFGPETYESFFPLKTKLPIILQPNAGLPQVGEPGTPPFYNLSPEDFANTMASLDVSYMGGCCGTSPAHIKALVKQVRG
ncbi:MAG: homocysteine S-methyltransferase family protein [Defluviitaleaceae bacterium]|nr:homocysteine S-methyltransferase family protein [Defluviitaleaceae bacterium]